MDYNLQFFGMNIIWWTIWFIVFSFYFSFFVPVLKKKIRRTPLEVLQNRLSKGEINVNEYEQRKRFIEKDHDLIARMFFSTRILNH